MIGKTSALSRSFDVYYRDAKRTARMDRLNASFVREGALVFDVGAHVGDRTASFRRLGATVVTVEPQPMVFRALRLIHGQDPKVVLLRSAVGSEKGEIDIHINSKNPTVSTASKALITAAARDARWQDQVWDANIQVPVTTLDSLITTHGIPDFIKIDVEGHELEVLIGLNTQIPVLSFEFTTIQRDLAYACLIRLIEIGRYEFNLSLGEDHQLCHEQWLSPEHARSDIEALPDSANSGDIYARLLA